jgi:hypothetical protein
MEAGLWEIQGIQLLVYLCMYIHTHVYIKYVHYTYNTYIIRKA